MAKAILFVSAASLFSAALAVSGSGDLVFPTLVPRSNTSSRPPSPTSSSPPVPSINPQLCYPNFDHHFAVQESVQKAGAEDACKMADGHVIRASDPGTSIHHVSSASDSDKKYIYDIYWVDGCKTIVDAILDAGTPLGGNGKTCASLLKDDYSNCINGGVGGRRSVGCVAYEFRISGE